MNVAALLHDAPSDDHRTRNDVTHHQHPPPPPPPPQPAHQHDHRFPPPAYPVLPSPASIIGLDDNRYDPRPPTRDRDRDRDRERERDRMLPLPHHPHLPYQQQQHPHPLHFPPPPPHHQQHIIPQPMLPPPPAHHSHQIHHHVYDYPHDARVKHPLAPPPDRERDRDRDRFPGPPGYPSSRTPPGYPPDQPRMTPAHRREPHIAPEPVMGSLREREREREQRERDRERERDSPPPSHPFMQSQYGHHTPFSPNPHGPMTQPLPPPLALAPHHAQPKQRRRDNATPPFMSDRERDRVADQREMVRERERDRQAREASLRDSRDAVGKVKRERERVKHPSLEERTLPLHPSHVQLVQRPALPQQPPQPHHKPSAFLVPNVPPPPQQQTLPLAPPNSKKHPQQQQPGTLHQHHPPPQPPRVHQPPPPPPRSPTPPAPQPPFDLGTWVFPRSPFPYFFPPDRERDVALKPKSEPPEEKKDTGKKDLLGLINGKDDILLARRKDRERERDVELTILIPRRHLPSHIPDPLPLFGGGGARRVYTDDSPIVLCALHAGFVTWSEVCAARDQRPGRDMKVRVRVRREGAGERGEWIGGPSAAGDAVAGVGAGLSRPGGGKKKGKERERTDESVGLVSRAWPAPHDGSGIEILAVDWIPSGVAHAGHLPNRRARLAEYAQRRQELMTLYEGDVGCKRPRRLPNAVALDPIVEEAEEEQLQARSLVWGRAGADLGFKFDPNAVRAVLFPEPDEDSSDGEHGHRPRKRRRMDADTDTTPSPSADAPDTREMILENDADRYLVSRCVAEGDETMDVDGGGRRYRISVFPRRVEREKSLVNGVDSLERGGQDSAVNGVPPKKPDGEKVDPPPVEQHPEAVKDLPKPDVDAPSHTPDTDKAPEPNGASATDPVPAPPVETNNVEAPPPPESAPAQRTIETPPKSETPPATPAPLQDIATSLEEGDIQFLPTGICIARRKLLADVDETRSKLGWFMEITRWRWRDVRL